MKIANRINSQKDEKYNLISDPKKQLEYLFNKTTELEGLTHVDLNYPEHFIYHTLKEIKEIFSKKNVIINGIAIRYYSYPEFKMGGFSNPNKNIRQKAIDETKKAIDISSELDTEITTIWPGQDGFELPFQIDSQKIWEYEVSAFKKICSYNPKNKISIEYKPYEPRVNNIFYSGAITLDFINEIKQPNLGITIDFAHSLASKEKTNIITSRILQKNLLFGVHLNDGYGHMDDGLMIGSINYTRFVEFMYLLKKYQYNGVLYIDSDPNYSDPTEEFLQNVKMLKKINNKLEKINEKELQKIQSEQSATGAMSIIYSLT